MTTDLTHAERVEALLSNPDRYGELVEAYEDGTKFYEKTRSKAPRVTHDFEDYLRFHEIFIDYGPSEYIYWSLERNTDRSIKNMLTGGSDAGETFRIYTLEQASQRVDSYRELGVQNTSLRGVVTTLLEELYEEKNTNKFIYHVLSTLLDRVPDSEPEVVELVARARLIAGVDTVHREQRILEELRQYLDETINPRPRDGRPADELLDEANQRSYSDPERVNLHRAALHKDPSIELLSEYLYLSGRDIVERYRHREMEDPTVGELQLCKRQFAIIQEFSVEHGAEDIAYIQSYYYLTKALYESGREWRSKCAVR